MSGGNNSDVLTKEQSLRGCDIEVGNSTGHLCVIENNASSSAVPFENMADGENIERQVVSIDEWVVSLERILEDVPDYMCRPGHPARICRIPENFREVDVKSYEPCFVSLGPYHHGKSKLHHMEKRKQIVLKCFLQQKPELALKDYFEEIKSIETDARSFYSNIEMESKTFLQMLLIDSLFILTVFCGMPESRERIKQTNNRITVDNEEMYERGNQSSEDIVSEDYDQNVQMMAVADESGDETWNEETNVDGFRWLFATFAHDLFLLENQLPFFVLQKMHAFAYGSSSLQLRGIMTDRVSNLLLNYTKLNSQMVIAPTDEIHHLLHLCHLFFHPKHQQESNDFQFPDDSRMFRLGSAVQLYEAGVRFEARSRSTEHSLLDITFDSSGKMIMPCLHVDDNTDSLLRNLIALEQMKYPSLGLHVSAYAVLMLHLITIPEDVKLLSRKGIIDHRLGGDKEMMYFVNRLSVGLSFDYMEDNYSLKPVFQELKRYTERRVPRWRAWLRHRYFNNPWMVISLVAASLLLLLTFVQTYYTLYSYYYPRLD